MGRDGEGVSGSELVAAAGIQPRVMLGAHKLLLRVEMNGNADIQYAPIHTHTQTRKRLNSCI